MKTLGHRSSNESTKKGERDSPLCGGTGWRGDASTTIVRIQTGNSSSSTKKIGHIVAGCRLLPPTAAVAAGHIASPRASWRCPVRSSASSSSSSSSSSSPSSPTARAATRMGPMFRAPATTNGGAICLSSRSRPPQHFASHLPRSFLRPSSPVVLLLLLLLLFLPRLPSPHRPFPATTSSSWSVGRSTFRPLSAVSSTASLLHFQPSSFFLLFLLFFSRFHLASPSTADRLLLSSSFLLDVYHLQVSGRRSILLTKMCTEKLIISVKNT